MRQNAMTVSRAVSAVGDQGAGGSDKTDISWLRPVENLDDIKERIFNEAYAASGLAYVYLVEGVEHVVFSTEGLKLCIYSWVPASLDTPMTRRGVLTNLRLFISCPTGSESSWPPLVTVKQFVLLTLCSN
ncbi:hypothetical protein J6590_026279 [Homalodisca vitripennis]|nr:hypothetical protein J6590_026279 [Homalodisca vitripennis]